MSSALLADNGIIQVLTFLLPGFVAAALYYFLTSYPKPNDFGKIIHALVFTAIGQSALIIVEWLSPIGGEWGIPISVAAAAISAVIVVGVSNNDLIHKFFRWIRFTTENSYPSVWYSTFSRNTDCYVVLHLTHNRQLYGWPSEWPTNPDDGHIRIIEGEWLDECGNPISAEIDQDRASIPTFLIPTKEIEMVEFIQSEPTDHKE